MHGDQSWLPMLRHEKTQILPDDHAIKWPEGNREIWEYYLKTPFKRMLRYAISWNPNPDYAGSKNRMGQKLHNSYFFTKVRHNAPPNTKNPENGFFIPKVLVL